MRIIEVEGHTFFPSLLGRASVVIDLGANLGNFSIELARLKDCRCFAAEPSPHLFRHLQHIASITAVHAAICGKSGPVTLNVASISQASSLKRLNGFQYLDSVTVPGKTLEEFVGKMEVNRIDLLKVDIEGAEIEMFDSCSDSFLSKIVQITVEFHDFAGVMTKSAVSQVLFRMKKAGFFVFSFNRLHFTDVLFVNRRQMSWPTYWWAMTSIWLPRAFRYARRKWLRHDCRGGNSRGISGQIP
jgi:FkbM family methyltransferase